MRSNRTWFILAFAVACLVAHRGRRGGSRRRVTLNARAGTSVSNGGWTSAASSLFSFRDSFGAPGNFEREPVIARQRLAALSATLTAQALPEPWGLWWRDRHKVGLIVAPSAHHAGTRRARTDEILGDAAGSRKGGPL